jgi:hypothetical protein
MFLNGSWAFGAPIAAGGDRGGAAGLVVIYKQIGQRLGLALFLPLVGGVWRVWVRRRTGVPVADLYGKSGVSQIVGQVVQK